MADDTRDLDRLHASIQEWVGLPADHIVALRHEGERTELPTALDVLFFDPVAGPREDDITTALTAGMSLQPAPGGGRFELVFEVRGSCDEALRLAAARGLGELALAPFREGWEIGDGTVIDELSIPPFTAMHHLLLKNWGPSGEVLPSTEPPVVVLRAIPLFADEAALAEERGPIVAVARLRRHGARFENYDRQPAV